jgi:hypothetical protein
MQRILGLHKESFKENRISLNLVKFLLEEDHISLGGINPYAVLLNVS